MKRENKLSKSQQNNNLEQSYILSKSFSARIMHNGSIIEPELNMNKIRLLILNMSILYLFIGFELNKKQIRGCCVGVHHWSTSYKGEKDTKERSLGRTILTTTRLDKQRKWSGIRDGQRGIVEVIRKVRNVQLQASLIYQGKPSMRWEEYPLVFKI